MAWITSLIVLCDGCIATTRNHSNYRLWEYLLAQGGISQDMIQDLKFSEIKDFSIPRAGVFLKYNDWT